MSEAAAAVAESAPATATTEPTAAETPPAEGAPPVAEAPKPEPKVEPKEFIALKREKARLHQESQALKTEKQQLTEAMTSIVAPVRDVLDKFDDNPLGALEFISRGTGKTVQQVFDALIVSATKHGDPPDPNDRIAKLERERAEEKAAAKAAREADETRLAEQAEAQMRADTSQLIGQFLKSNADEYEMLVLNGEKSHKDLMDLAETWHTSIHAHLEPTMSNVAQALEAQYLAEREEQAKRYSQSKKLSKFYAPPQPAPAEPAAQTTPAASTTTANAALPAAGNTAKQALPIRTINSRQAAVPAGVTRVIRKPSSDLEVIDRAAALMPSRYQKRP